METIIIVLNPGKMENPDLDLRYTIPDRIEEVTEKAVEDNGYDYIDGEEGQPGPLLGIWLKTESAAEQWPVIVRLFGEETFAGNHLLEAAEIYISPNDTEEMENCVRVYPDTGGLGD